ncbi:spermidine synthase [Ruminococcus flavefaciens]|uniref:Spermidine synthase n=1 Tax=Ruminococcus flavefaciens TaxID=1265 RepID=A0A315YQ27_RUMFL|nr:fused MFS/spermidine synthase [Ruminococcus flavefaciens]PWJ14122.1 spermidine synthase [Ruminococcus flavefaciens]SSA43816.1 Spermidine synthase [Ruminococcus flavefaciens]
MKNKNSKAAEKKPLPRILKNKWYLYMTEFFAGMSVMAVELGASRLLAPYFSSSQIVWTIIIGTIMIAMALGNIYGGRSADKNPDTDKLYGRILIAAVWIAAVPFIGKLAIAGIAGLLVVTINTNFLIWAAFITCMVVFVYPLFLLGTVTPSLVKYTVDSLDDSGRTVGTLGAANTIGSIIGTFVPTFISIPAVGTAVTFLIFAGIMLVIGLVYFISSKRGAAKTAIASVLFIVCCFASPSMGFAFWEKGLTYEGESVYNYLQVKDDDENTYLSTNVLFGVQSVYVKSGELSDMYYDYAMAAPLMTESPDTADILVLGMGTGTYAKQCLRYFSGAKAEGVEIDEKITDLAHKYFELPEDIKVTTYDGRAFLAACDKKYDVIMVDAYQDITIPFQMSSVEFFTLVKDHLNEGGVMVVNMNMRSESADGINGCLADTISSVFDNVVTVDVEYSTNRELFATNSDEFMDRFEANTAALKQEDLRRMMQIVRPELEPYTAGDHILTDDKAPVELLGMKVIDDIIQDELVYYKEAFKEKGIKGLLE